MRGEQCHEFGWTESPVRHTCENGVYWLERIWNGPILRRRRSIRSAGKELKSRRASTVRDANGRSELDDIAIGLSVCISNTFKLVNNFLEAVVRRYKLNFYK